MSEIPKYLPLSQRPRRNESGVTNNWSARLGSATTLLLTLLNGLDPAAWDRPSLRPRYTVGFVANEVLARLVSTPWQRLVPGPTSELDRPGVVAALGPAGTRPRARIGDLAAVIVAGYDIAAATGGDFTVDPISSGAVALALNAAAPMAVRSVLRDHRFAAIGAEWQVGAGPRVEATASAIVLFLAGRGPVPVQTAGG